MISSLLHLVGLRPRVYYTLTNFRGGGAGGQGGQYANEVSINSGLKSFWNQMTPFQNNGESGNSNNSVRKIIDVHENQSEFCAFSNHQENDKITKDD